VDVHPICETAPAVSICLPVHNGERYLGEAIDSILGQTFEDIELIISDNASTDRTEEICREAAERDRRIRYFRADRNRGLAWNHNQAMRLARGRYAAWIGHDDVMTPDFIGRCVAALDTDPSAVLCFANASYIDATGADTAPLDLRNPGKHELPSERFSQILYDDKCDAIYGLMRRDVLMQTRLHGAYADSDRVLLAEMGFRGSFHFLTDRLFHRRMHPQQTTARYKDRWERTAIFDPRKAGKASFPWVHEAWDFFTAIWRSPITWTDRSRCYKYLYWWLAVHSTFVWQDVRRGFSLAMKRFGISFTARAFP
jgi:glycosyltransferase involved in cell wall biosynthesis